MEKCNNTNILNQCRTCMNSTYLVSSVHDILQDVKLSTIANLLLHKHDARLPNLICQSCLDKLIEFYEFQQMCIRTEQKLLEILKKPKRPLVIEKSEHNLKDPLDNDINQTSKMELPGFLMRQNEEMYSPINKLNECLDVSIATHCVYDFDITYKPKLGQLNKSLQEEISMGPSVNSKLSDNKSLNTFMSKTKNGHILRKNKKQLRFMCNICGKSLSASGVLNRHIRQVHGNAEDESPVSVSDILSDINKTVQLDLSNISKRTDIETSSDEKTNPKLSNICGNKTSGDESLTKIHKQCKFTCNICGKQLSSSGVLTRHKRLVHCIIKDHNNKDKTSDKKVENGASGSRKLSKRPHFCKYCNKGFSIPTRLRDHERVHTGERPHLCSQCGLGFKTASNLIQHLYRHKGDKRYECPHCPKRFICLADLGSHKASHNKDKPIVCDICDKRFAKTYLLRRHKLYHSNEKPHKCDYCDMRFVMACQMRSHRRIHTGEKPYKCKYCPRIFAQSTDVAKHLRSHLGVNIHSCELCPQRFRLNHELRAHFVTHKNEDDRTRCKNLQALKNEEERLQMKFSNLSNTSD